MQQQQLSGALGKVERAVARGLQQRRLAEAGGGGGSGFLNDSGPPQGEDADSITRGGDSARAMALVTAGRLRRAARQLAGARTSRVAVS